MAPDALHLKPDGDRHSGLRSLWRRGYLDYVVAAVSAVVVLILVESEMVALPALDQIGRRAVYQTLTTLSGTLMGLTITAASLLLANLDKPIAALRNGLPAKAAQSLVRSVFQLVRSLGLLCLINLMLLVVNTDLNSQSGLWPVVLEVLAGAVVVARFVRMLYWLWKFAYVRAGQID